MINIIITSFQATVFIIAVLTFFFVSGFVFYQYLMHDKQIKNQIDEVLLNHTKYIKKETEKQFDKHEELIDETHKIANKIIDKLNRAEESYIKNLKTVADAIIYHAKEREKLEDKIALRNHEIMKLQNKIREKDGIIARKTKQIQRLKDEI